MPSRLTLRRGRSCQRSGRRRRIARERYDNGRTIASAPRTDSGRRRGQRAAWRAALDELAERRAAAAEGGAAKARERHVARGKLLARERVARLIDPGSPFLEIGALAAYGMYEGDVHGAGLVAGIGRIAGPRDDDRRQRSHHQGRRLLSDDGEEASARAGDRR